MHDRDMLQVPISLYRRPAGVQNPLTPHSNSRTRRIVFGILILAVLSIGIAALPFVANWSEFALPGGGRGLPWRFHANGHVYDNHTVCAYRRWCGDTPNYLSHETITVRGHAPLVRVGTLPTLFGLEHAVYAPAHPTDILGRAGWYVYVQDGDRYVYYLQGGGP